MKKLIYSLLLSSISLLFVTFSSNSSGPANNGNARTGAPGAPDNGSTCQGCHGGSTGGLNAGAGSVMLNYPNGTSYEPGQTYSLSVNVSTSPVNQYGFQITAIDDNTQSMAGSFVAGANNQVNGVGGRSYIEQLSANNTGSFTFDWNAPATNVGDITFYFVGNQAQAGGTNTDEIYSGTLTVSPAVAASGQCMNLFFSEYIEGSSNNKALEIYNPTSSTVDLANYSISRFTNGSSTGSNIGLSGMLAPDSVFIIANSSADPAILAGADMTLGSISHNGDEAYALLNFSDTIDVIGEIGNDPGSSWPVGTGSTQNQTLVRKPYIYEGTTDWTIGDDQWDTYPNNTFDSLDTHYMLACVTPPPATDPVLSFIQTSSTVNEDTITHLVEVNIQDENGNSTMVDVLIGAASTANSPADFTISPSTLVFPANSNTAQMITITVVDDATVESSETIVLGLDNATNSASFSDSVHTVTILDNDNSELNFAMATVNVQENAGLVSGDLALASDSICTINVANNNPVPMGICKNLFISEYIEGTDWPNNHLIEVYNPTQQIIDLSHYFVGIHHNGNQIPYLFGLNGYLAPDSVYSIANVYGDTPVTQAADTLTNAPTGSPDVFNFEENDILALYHHDSVIDRIGVIGQSPSGIGWYFGPDSNFTNMNAVLIRKSYVQQGTLDWDVGKHEWRHFGINMFDSIGTHSMLACGERASIKILLEHQQIERVENQDTVMVRVWLETADFSDTLNFSLSLDFTSDSAVQNVDFQFVDTQFTVLPYEYHYPRLVPFIINHDYKTEETDSIYLLLNSSDPRVLLADSQLLIKIQDNDYYELSFNGLSQVYKEQDTTVMLDVKFSNPNPDSVWYKVQVINGSASIGSDYDFNTHESFFMPLDISKQQIPVMLYKDELNETNEQIVFKLSTTQTGIEMGSSVYTLFIIDDDTISRLSELTPSNYELQIGPNPSKGTFRIYSDVASGKLQLIDQSGKLLITDSVCANCTTTMNINSAGLYLLIARFPDGYTIKRIIVQD